MKSIMSRFFIAGISVVVAAIFFNSCTRSKAANIVAQDALPGLWIGSYSVGNGTPVESGTSFFFSFSIYPDGKLSYKSEGFYNGSKRYITFADGTWQLKGNTFSFSVKTLNYPGSTSETHQQGGTANFNSMDATLTDGRIFDMESQDGASWTMKKVK